jgi:hypothetical protein
MFLETLGKDMREVIKTLIRWCGGLQRYSIISKVRNSSPLQNILN